MILRHLFAAYGITHGITPVKGMWLALVWIAIAMKLTLAWRSWQVLPALSLHMMAASLSGALQSTPLWGLWGEAIYSITAMLFVAELLYVDSFPVLHRVERRYIRGWVLSMVACLLGFAMFLSPRAYPGWPLSLFYLHLYTVTGCCIAATCSYAYHFARGTISTALSSSWVASIWFGIATWTGTWPGDKWAALIVGAAVHVGCLAAWLTGSVLRGDP